MTSAQVIPPHESAFVSRGYCSAQCISKVSILFQNIQKTFFPIHPVFCVYFTVFFGHSKCTFVSSNFQPLRLSLNLHGFGNKELLVLTFVHARLHPSALGLAFV